MNNKKFSKHLILCIAVSGVSLSLNGCDKNKTDALKLAGLTFANQSVAAISSVENIYDLDTQLSTEDTLQDSVKRLIARTSPSYNWSDLNGINELIEPPQSTPEEPTLKEMFESSKAGYREFGNSLLELDKLNIGTPLLVSKTNDWKKTVEKLTVKMYWMSKVMLEAPPRPFDSQRKPIAIELGKLDREFHDPGTTKEKKQILQKLIGIKVDEWNKVAASENKLLCEAVANTQEAVKYGIDLSTKTEDFSKFDISTILAKFVEILSTTSNLSGIKFGSIGPTAVNLQQDIEKNPGLRNALSTGTGVV
jgi:hypothetical protein